MIVGSNMAYAHPVLFRRLEEAKSRRPQMKVIVIDPRRTDTCDLADLHLAILPGTDVALFHGILHCCCGKTGSTATSSRRTPKVCRTEASGARLHPANGCATVRDQRRAAAAVRRMGGHLASFLSLWCMGLNQSTAGSAKTAR
jgi:assimilatory nitrate reductase catalytic subunit